MKLHQFVLGLFFISTAIAISLSSAVVRVNDKTIHFGEITTQEIKQLDLQSTKDKIDIEVYLNEVTDQPHQAIISLGNGKGLEFPLFPKFSMEKKAFKASLTASKIPINIRNLENIIITLIVGKSGEDNLYMTLGELIPNEEFKGLVAYKKAPRIGYKPEIHHIFREDIKTVNPFIPIVFIGAAIILFLGLIGVWIAQLGDDMNGLTKSIPTAQAFSNSVFLLCIVGYEIIFFRYYLGTSIFSTLFQCFVLSIPSIFYGASALKHFAHLRQIGKA